MTFCMLFVCPVVRLCGSSGARPGRSGEGVVDPPMRLREPTDGTRESSLLVFFASFHVLSGVLAGASAEKREPETLSSLSLLYLLLSSE